MNNEQWTVKQYNNLAIEWPCMTMYDNEWQWMTMNDYWMTIEWLLNDYWMTIEWLLNDHEW